MNQTSLFKMWTVPLRFKTKEGGSWSLQSLAQESLATELEFIQSQERVIKTRVFLKTDLENVLSDMVMIILSKGLDINPNNLWPQIISVKIKKECWKWGSEFLDPTCPYISSVIRSSVLWSLVVHKERGKRGRFSFSIIHFHLGHKVAATLGLVHGSICLILQAERNKLILISKSSPLDTVQMFTISFLQTNNQVWLFVTLG